MSNSIETALPEAAQPRLSLAAEQQAAFDADVRRRAEATSRDKIEGDAARRGAMAAIGCFRA